MLRVCALACLVLGGCAGVFAFPFPVAPVTATAHDERPALTVVIAPSVANPEAARAAIQRALGSSFEISFAALPATAPPPRATAAIEAELAGKRTAYINADFTACLAGADDAARALTLLGEGERLLGARLLFWNVACRVGGGHLDDARREAAVFAALELALPADVEAAAPEVELILAEAGKRVAAAARHPLSVRAAAGDAVVSIDGRPALCVAPCVVDVAAGDHMVRVDADGFAPEARITRVAGPATVLFTLTAADPALAAQQWTARQARAPALDSATSVSLLAVALRARSLAVIVAESAPAGQRLLGVLGTDGTVAARGERLAEADEEVPDSARALLQDLLLRGRMLEPSAPLYKRPLFWVAVGLTAAAAATITALILYQPPPQVSVEL